MTTPSNPRIKILTCIVISIAVGAVLVSSLPYVTLALVLLRDSWQEWQRCRGYTQFNTQDWQDPSLQTDPHYVRSCMVDDLLATGQLIGQTQAEVVQLLGDPDPSNGFADYNLVYILGPERSFISIDYEWLVIKLDAQANVSEARLVTD